jgi:BolA protein
MDIKKEIENILIKSFSISHLEIDDLSDLHKGHKEAKISGGGHYDILIVSDYFEGKSLIMRHRNVYKALENLLKDKIHALSLKVLTGKEFENIEGK